jgi:hypothetical protein
MNDHRYTEYEVRKRGSGEVPQSHSASVLWNCGTVALIWFV